MRLVFQPRLRISLAGPSPVLRPRLTISPAACAHTIGIRLHLAAAVLADIEGIRVIEVDRIALINRLHPAVGAVVPSGSFTVGLTGFALHDFHPRIMCRSN